MNSEQKLPGFLATRSIGDRRNQKLCAPPYSTGTGFVLIERRSGNDRRAASDQPQTVAEMPGNINQKIHTRFT
jgi:hypothetical protein